MTVEVRRGDGPLVLGLPHTGTSVPPDCAGRLNARGRELADTDWHIHKLYDGLVANSTSVRTLTHRYVIDVNRDPEGVSLYPGQNTTTLCPTTDFDGYPIWQEGQAPSVDEIMARRDAYHEPYHAALREELERVKARHGVAILYDCHSIRSQIPFLFDGVLPVFSIGTNNGQTCDAAIEAATDSLCRNAEGYDSVLNGRFKGGWTTRHYGRPENGVHAIQMELAQRAYMDETPPWTWREDDARQLRDHLSKLLNNLNEIALSGALQA